MYDDQGNCKPFLSTDTKQVFKRSNAVITPMRLYWDVNEELAKSIDEAYRFSIKVSQCYHTSIGNINNFITFCTVFFYYLE